MSRPWKAAAAWSAACSALFVLVYSGCTAITARRTDVGALPFAWESSIPFVPAMIIPYWSLDLFFVAAFFVCRDRRELDTLGKRIVTAILAAGTCFLLVPLRCEFPRRDVDGFLGVLFYLLRGFDLPYNKFPSLHIALLTLVLPVFLRRTKGLGRALLVGWFGLIAASTVLTYQHHVIDLAGGWVLAMICCYLFREEPLVLPRTGNPRIGVSYAIGSGVALGLTFLTPAFAWPALAMALLAAGYFGIGPSIYGKRGHSPSVSARILLAPCLLGQYVSWWYYRRRSRAWDEIVPGVWMGRRLADGEAAQAVRAGVTAVVDLTAEFRGAGPFRNLPGWNLPLLDLTAPTVPQLRDAAAFIAEQSQRGTVYVHCKAGYSRSAAAIGAYLLHCGRARTPDEAIAILRRARPRLVVRPEARDALAAFEREAGRP